MTDNGRSVDGGRTDDDSFPRMWVRLTADVGDIEGIDGREYDCREGFVRNLPRANAEPLLEKDAATRVFTPSPDAPAEPIVEDDGSVKIVVVHDDETNHTPPELQLITLGTWECQRCGTTCETGVGEDGELIEPHECVGCQRQGPFIHAGGLTEQDIRTATAAASGYWHAPTGLNGPNADSGFDTLWDAVRNHLQTYWAAGDDTDWVYDGLTAYALSTWVRENLRFVPHILLRGATTGGKTRLLNTLARVSYRGMVAASATPASMYRLIDAYDVTFLVSEYHGLSPDTRRELDNIVRAGQKRGEVVTRAEPTSDGYQPMTFDPFAHVALASQYDPDDDILNRCIQVRSAPPKLDLDIPVDFNEDDAAALRSRLLSARYRLLYSHEWDQAEADGLDWLAEREIDGRTREKLLALVTVAHLCDRLDDLTPFVETVVEQDEQARADSEDALFIEAVRDLAHEAVGNTQVLGDGDPYAAVELPYDDLATRYATLAGLDADDVANTWVGHVRSRLGFEKDRKRDGSVLADPNLGPKLRDKCAELGVDWQRDPADVADRAPELPDDEKGPGASGCPECGRDRNLTHRNAVEGGRICADCAGALRDAQNRNHSRADGDGDS